MRSRRRDASLAEIDDLIEYGESCTSNCWRPIGFFAFRKRTPWWSMSHVIVGILISNLPCASMLPSLTPSRHTSMVFASPKGVTQHWGEVHWPLNERLLNCVTDPELKRDKSRAISVHFEPIQPNRPWLQCVQATQQKGEQFMLRGYLFSQERRLETSTISVRCGSEASYSAFQCPTHVQSVVRPWAFAQAATNRLPNRRS